MGLLYFIEGRYEDAVTCLSKSIELNPELSQPYMFIAFIMLLQEKKAEVSFFYHKAIELDN
jgi:tetratricopeptide (TPR) repeat protein